MSVAIVGADSALASCTSVTFGTLAYTRLAVTETTVGALDVVYARNVVVFGRWGGRPGTGAWTSAKGAISPRPCGNRGGSTVQMREALAGILYDTSSGRSGLARSVARATIRAVGVCNTERGNKYKYGSSSHCFVSTFM